MVTFWFAWVILLALIAVGLTALSVWGLMSGGGAGIFLCLCLAIACAATLLRLLPFPRTHPTALPAGVADAAGVAEWVAEHSGGWRPTIQLVPEPDVWTNGEVLMLGLPLLLCLRGSELVVLLQEARAQQASDSAHLASALALRLARGRVGRTLGVRDKPGATPVERRIFAPIHRRLERFTTLRSDRAVARRASYGESWHRVIGRAQTVDEAWSLMGHQWLGPALTRDVWYEEPFSTLQLFLDSCALANLIEDVDRLPGDDIRLDLAEAEHDLARRLVGDVARQDHGPGHWLDHPTEVDVPRWRESLARGLHRASMVAGRPIRASITDLLQVVTDAEVALAAALAPNGSHAPSDEDPDLSAINYLLACATAVALIDAGRGFVTWEWPGGTSLEDHTGQPLALDLVVTDRAGLPTWLKQMGVDPQAPLWLGEGEVPAREEPLYAFNAKVDGSRRRVVITNQALRIFGKTASPLFGFDALFRPDKSPATRDAGWAAVESGDFPDGTRSISWSDVADAQLVPTLRDATGWRLRLRTATGPVEIRYGSGIDRTHHLVSALIGSRFRRVGPPRLRGFPWNFLRPAAVILGGFTAILGAAYMLDPTTTSSRSAAFTTGLIGLAVATSPVTLRALRVWRSERRLRRETHAVGYW